jgi:hypothetical protein
MDAYLDVAFLKVGLIKHLDLSLNACGGFAQHKGAECVRTQRAPRIGLSVHLLSALLWLRADRVSRRTDDDIAA